MPSAERQHVFRFPSAPRYAGAARRVVRRFLIAAEVPQDVADDLESAVGEAIANAIEHGYRPGTYFSVAISCKDDVVEVQVEDNGTGFILVPSKADPGRMRGFGMTIMRTLTDEVKFDRGGRRVSLRKDGVFGKPEQVPAQSLPHSTAS
jgi:anti-sigma regulatory factor (Ser/Thr protein kinase)